MYQIERKYIESIRLTSFAQELFQDFIKENAKPEFWKKLFDLVNGEMLFCLRHDQALEFILDETELKDSDCTTIFEFSENDFIIEFELDPEEMRRLIHFGEF